MTNQSEYCPNCGSIFALEEGMGSQKWHPHHCMCATCLADEAWEIDHKGEQPKFPKNMPLRLCRTKNMVPSDTPMFRPNLRSANDK